MAEAARAAARVEAPEAVADDRLHKAAAYIEEEEGATSRYRGWLAQLTTALLVGMSLFHLYAAVDIVPAQVLRPVHVGWTLLLVFLLFPIAARFRNRLMWWDVVLRRARRRDDRLPARRRRRLLGPQHGAEPRRRLLRRRLRAAGPRSGAPHVGLDHAVRDQPLPRVRVRRPVAARAVDASRLRCRRACRASCTRRSRGFSAPRSTCRRRSSSCSRSTARFCSTRARASSISIGASPRWAAGTAARDAPSCSRRSCSADRRGRVSRRR